MEDVWWRGAVIYQVYPRSFQDTNDDGIGDLPGITQRLEHIAALGVDAVWISPFFKSPQADYGYDVENYREVDPLFGSLEDFDHLIARAHALGLKVMIDMVLSHTSNRHPWFLEARRSRDNPKADWYVFADWKDDGTAPNNWLSVFGGPAWEWEPRRGQYYLHNFLPEQPDLNIHNPAVVEALLSEVEFWLERGVDGLRLDAVDFAVHDPELRDNPARPAGDLPGGLIAGTPYSRQRHIHSRLTEAVPDKLLKPLRKLADRYGTVLLGELSGEGQLERMADFSRGKDVLHFGYSFAMLGTPLAPRAFRDLIESVERSIDDGWACWSLSNHDVVRAVSRLGGAQASPQLSRMLPALLASLRGTICLYQGEELGLPEAELAFEDLRDPPGIALWPDFQSRDGARTPMPWSASRPHGGFSDARPWLPMPFAHLDLAVDLQDYDPQSTLSAVRRFFTWRHQQPELRLGSIDFLDAPEPILAFERRHGGRALLCAFNLSAAPARWPDPPSAAWLDGHGLTGRLAGDGLDLPPYAGFIGRLD